MGTNGTAVELIPAGLIDSLQQAQYALDNPLAAIAGSILGHNETSHVTNVVGEQGTHAMRVTDHMGADGVVRHTTSPV